MNPNPSGNFGYTASFIDVRGNTYYSQAVSNFLGEVENFYVAKNIATVNIATTWVEIMIDRFSWFLVLSNIPGVQVCDATAAS